MPEVLKSLGKNVFCPAEINEDQGQQAKAIYYSDLAVAAKESATISVSDRD